MRWIIYAAISIFAVALLSMTAGAQEYETHIWKGDGGTVLTPELCITRDMIAIVAPMFGYQSLPASDGVLVIKLNALNDPYLKVTFDGMCAMSAEVTR